MLDALATWGKRAWPIVRFLLTAWIVVFLGIHLTGAETVLERVIYGASIAIYCTMLMVLDIWIKVMQKGE